MLTISWVKTLHQLHLQSTETHSVTNAIVLKFKQNWFFIFIMHIVEVNNFTTGCRLRFFIQTQRIHIIKQQPGDIALISKMCEIHARRCHINCLELDDSCLEPLQSQYHRVISETRKTGEFLSVWASNKEIRHRIRGSKQSIPTSNKQSFFSILNSNLCPVWRVSDHHRSQSRLMWPTVRSVLAQWHCRHFVQRIKWICVFGLVTSWVHLLK